MTLTHRFRPRSERRDLRRSTAISRFGPRSGDRETSSLGRLSQAQPLESSLEPRALERAETAGPSATSPPSPSQSSGNVAEGDTGGPLATEASAQQGQAPNEAAQSGETETAANSEASSPQAQGDQAPAAPAEVPVLGGPAETDVALPADPPLPAYEIPDLNAIRTPIVRPPPLQALAQSAQVVKTTGTPPSQHHANIQSAVLRVTDATRQAQRELVQTIDGLAARTRFSIEDLADSIDGIVERCAATVAGAAQAALGDIDRAAAEHEQTIKATQITADHDMKARKARVTQQIVTHLKQDGSAEMHAVHAKMGTAFDGHATALGERLRVIPAGEKPQLLSGPPGTKSDFEWIPPPEETAASYPAEATRLVQELTGAPPEGQSGGYYAKYIGLQQAAVLPSIGEQSRIDWSTGLHERMVHATGEQARNAFFLSMLGLVAPTAKAMKEDEEEFKTTLNVDVQRNLDAMDAATVPHYRAFREQHFNIQNFFDLQNPNSMPAKSIKGLRDSGVKIKTGLRAQARAYHANIRASAATLAAAYPDVVLRLGAILEGDDLMDAAQMMPRIDGVSDTVRQLFLGHVAVVQGQADQALVQTREGFDAQVVQLWLSVDKIVSNTRDFKLKALFGMEMQVAQFTGHFGDTLVEALDRVSGFADDAALRLMAPIRAGREAGEKVERAVVNHFNGTIVREWNEHAEAVGEFKSKTGYNERLSIDHARSTAKEPLPKLHAAERLRLSKAAIVVAEALPVETLGDHIADVATVVGVGVFTGGTGLVALGGYHLYSENSKFSKVAAAVGGLEWLGPLAMEEAWKELGLSPDKEEETGLTRIRRKAQADRDWNQIAALFSTSKAVNTQAKLQLVKDATWVSGIHDEAITAITQSLSAEDRAMLTPEEIEAMSASIRNNLTGLDEKVALAYLDGDRALALALRFEDAIKTARQSGEASMRDLGSTLNTLIAAEMSAPGFTGYANAHETRALTDQMYLALAERIPAAGQGNRSINYHSESTSSAIAYAGASHGNIPAQDVTADPADKTNTTADTSRGWYRPNRSDAQTAARQKVADYITRDFVQHDTELHRAFGGSSWFGGGSDSYLADEMIWLQNQLGGGGQAPELVNWDGRIRRGGLIYDAVSADTQRDVANFVMHGSQSSEYRHGRGASILRTAGQQIGGTSQAEFVSLLNFVEDSDFSLALTRYEELRDNPDADPEKLAEALQTYNAAKSRRDQDILAMASDISGKERGDLSISEARQILADRIDQVAESFNGDINSGTGSVGQEILETGRMDLSRGISVATMGAGTYDDLLMQTTGQRHKQEVIDAGFHREALLTQSARSTLDGQASLKHAQRRRDELGLGDSWFGETSGDQAQQLAINLEGVPENDADHLRIANMRTRHEAIEGVGFISSMTMSDSWQRRFMYDRHDAMRQRLVRARAAYRAENGGRPLPEPFASMTAEELLPLNGDPPPEVAEFLLDKKGHLLGEGPNIELLAAESQLANKAHRDEIARQESFFTGVITAVTVAVSVLLLVVPGVNVAAAGVLTALLGGALTVGAKQGMRGGRYGWEEAAVDIGKSAIEAATAGAGGALGGAVNEGMPVLGRLASVGRTLNQSLGSVGSAVAREGITSAVSGVANQALDDRIWAKGLSHGIGELAKSGLKGGVTGAISGGVSESVTKGLNQRLNRTLGEGGDRLAGATARHAMLQEALSGLAGATVSDAAAMAMDIADGKMKFSWTELGKRLGTAGLREVLSGAGRAGIQHRHRQAYHAQLKEVMARGGDMSPAEARFMRRLAISAGHENYGRADEDPHATSDRQRYDFTAIEAYQNSVKAAAQMLGDLPPSVRIQVEGMSFVDLQKIHGVLVRGAGGLEKGALADLKVTLATTYPGVDPVGLIKTIEGQRRTDKAQAQSARVAQQKHHRQENAVRKVLFQGADRDLRIALRDAPVSEIASLPKALQQEAGRIIAGGAGPGALTALIARVKALPEGGDAMAQRVQDQIVGLTQARSQASAETSATRAQRRRAVQDLMPEEARGQIGKLSDSEIAFLHRLTQSDAPSDQQRKNMQRLLDARLGDGADLLNAMAATAAGIRQRKADARLKKQRAERLEFMAHIPEALRPLLSNLSGPALMQIAFAQSGGLRLTKGDITAMARRAASDAGVDADQVHAAIVQALKAGSGLDQRGFFARVAHRRALLEFIPKQMRGAIKRTPLLQLPDEMFFAYVRSAGQQAEHAVTLMLDGKPVVLIREGAPRHALGEEGEHVLRAANPAWARRMALLNEEDLENWSEMPAADKARRAQVMLEAELSGHRYMLEELDLRLMRIRDAGARIRLMERQAKLEARVKHLQARAVELAYLGPRSLADIDAGRRPLPTWLERPPRLFMEDTPQADTKRDTETARERDQKSDENAGLSPQAKAQRAVDDLIQSHPEVGDKIRKLFESISYRHGDNRLLYVQALGKLAVAAQASEDVRQAIRKFIDTDKASDTQRLRLLRHLIQPGENDGLLDALGHVDTAKGQAALAVLNWMTKALETPEGRLNTGRKLPKFIEDLLYQANQGAGKTAPGIWIGLKHLMDLSTTADPKDTEFSVEIWKTMCQEFTRAISSKNFHATLASFFSQTHGQPDFAQQFHDRFANGFLADPVELIGLGDISEPLRQLAGMLQTSDADIGAEQRAALQAQLTGPDSDLDAFLTLANRIATELRARNLGSQENIAIALHYSIELTKLDHLNWKGVEDFSGVRIENHIKFEDVLRFILVAGESGVQRNVKTLSVIYRLLAHGDEWLTPRVFRIFKNPGNQMAGTQFRINDLGEVSPRFTRSDEAPSEQAIADFKTIFDAAADLRDRMDAAGSLRGNGFKTHQDTPETVTRTDPDVTMGLPRFNIPLDLTWSEQKVFLQRIADALAAEGVAAKDRGNLVAKLESTFLEVARAAQADPNPVTASVTLKFTLKKNGVLSIYVGSGAKILEKEAAKVTVGTNRFLLDISGGDTYPALVNRILSNLSEPGRNTVKMLEQFIADASSFDTTGVSAETLKRLNVLRTIVAGSEVLRDPMSAVALMLSIYVFHDATLVRNADEPDVRPMQAMLGHNFFRQTQIDAAKITGSDKQKKLLDAMTAAGMGKTEADLITAMMKGALARNQLQGGGVAPFSRAEFLQHHLDAVAFAFHDPVQGAKPKTPTRGVSGLIDSYHALFDLALQRYFLENPDAKREFDKMSAADQNAARQTYFKDIMGQMERRMLRAFKHPETQGNGDAD